MSSEYGSKSYADLKAQAKQGLAAASKPEPAFLVTEKNWSSLLKSLDGILEMQAAFSAEMQTLASREELEKTLERQRTMMQVHLDDMKVRTAEFRTSIETTGTNLQTQVGNASARDRRRHLERGNVYEILEQEAALDLGNPFGGAASAGAGALDLVGSLSRLKGDSDDPEERKREIEAQTAADNLGVAIGLAIAAAEAILERENEMKEQTM